MPQQRKKQEGGKGDSLPEPGGKGKGAMKEREKRTKLVGEIYLPGRKRREKNPVPTQNYEVGEVGPGPTKKGRGGFWSAAVKTAQGWSGRTVGKTCQRSDPEGVSCGRLPPSKQNRMGGAGQTHLARVQLGLASARGGGDPKGKGLVEKGG